MAVPFNAFIQLKLQCVCKDQWGINILHYKRTDAVVPPLPEANVAVAMDALWAPLLKAAISSEAGYMGLSVRVLNPTGLPAIVTASAGAGTGGAQVLPRQVSGIITKRTEFAGRSYRGRMYVPFPSEADSDTFGAPNAGYLGALSNIAIQMVSVVTVGAGYSFQPVVYQRANILNSAPIINYRVNDRFATQKRRGSYGKQNSGPIT